MSDKLLSYSLARGMGFLKEEEVDFLKSLARDLAPDSIVVIIGSGPGTATLAIAEECPHVHIFSIDIKPAPGETIHLKEEKLSHLVTQILGDSKEVGRTWNEPIDFLFVDGCHLYESVVADIETWTPHLKDGAIVAFHDYGTEHDMWLRVKKAVDEHFSDQEEVGRAHPCSIAFRWSIKGDN